MPRYAETERRALADLFLTVGPDAPTLNEGWTTRDLAAHLVVRDRRPDAAAGILLAPLRDYSERVRLRVAGQPWERLVEQVRRAPWWTLAGNPLTDELVNTVEFFVHLEDVRRAQPGWEPRELPVGLTKVLWRRVSPLARLGLRRFPARVRVRAPGLGEIDAGGGGEAVELVGPPGELTMFLFGRQRASRVQLGGPPELVGRLSTATLGI